ncbi:UNVERIFIED_CONTAM: hypothetical protein GTU68_052830, partial [Idotea baltica]|nr:hypothetical protein [Idotea baltica]
KLIVGLGNPGSEYEGTRHNVGFDFLDYLFLNLPEISWKNKFGANFTSLEYKSEKVFFVKPFTYMNLSGEPLRKFCAYFKIDINEVIVCYDDIDLDIGNLRLRDKGGAGGHNGIKSIISEFGVENFTRLKIGISRPKFKVSQINHQNLDELEVKEVQGSVSNWVLGKFSDKEKLDLEDVFNRGLAICRTLLKSGFKDAQQRGKFKPKKISNE